MRIARNTPARLAALALGLLASYQFSTKAIAAELPPDLGSATTFGVLAATTVTNNGEGTVINGDVGVSPGTAITGFPPGQATGTIYYGGPEPAAAQEDLTTAYNDLATRPNAMPLGGEAGGLILGPGLYKADSSAGITGNLTLDGQGDPNAVFVFQIGSTLTTAVGSNVILINGARAGNIFWQVGSSATLGGTSTFKGNILANVSIGVGVGASLDGKALARSGAVTLDGGNAVVANELDLSIQKTDSPDPVTVNEPLTYEIVVSNQSLTTATDVLVTDTLTMQVDFVSVETTGSTICSRDDRDVTCSLAALPPGETAYIQLVVQPNQTGDVRNTAGVSANEPESVTNNNSSTAQTTVLAGSPVSDLSITKTTQDTQTTVGEHVTYQLEVLNSGPDSASQVIVTDNLPLNSIFVSATPSQGSCSRSGSTLTCNLGTVAGGATATIEVVVAATTAGTMVNTASVSSNSGDPNPANNSDSASSTVNGLDGTNGNCPDLTARFTTEAFLKCRTTLNGEKCKAKARVMVTNIGAVPAANKTFLVFFLSQDQVLDSSDRYLGYKKIRKLLPGQSRTVNVKAKLPFGVSGAGQYLLVEADGGQTIYPECNEDNNTAASGPM